MFDRDTMVLIAQIAAAVGECLSALIAGIALIFAAITVRRMQEQNRIAAEAAGWSRIICQVHFANSIPASAKPLLPPDVETLSQREPLKQLHDVLKRWWVKTPQLPQHRVLVIILKSDSSSTGTVSPRNISITIKIRIPPYPGKNYVSRRDPYTIPIFIDIFDHNEVFFLPIENILACDIVVKGVYQFTGQSYNIGPARHGFDDYDQACGIAVIAGGEDASPA